MNFTIAMWAVWGVLVLLVFGLYMYRARLSRDEEDELYLDEAFAAQRNAQAAIRARVAKIEPAIRITRWIVLAVTLFVVIFYVHDFLIQFQSSNKVQFQ